MATMLIANNCTRESGSFMGDQLCSLKAAYLFVQNQPGVDRVLMSMSKANEMNFVWQKFIDDPMGNGSIPPIEVFWDDWNPGDWWARHHTWDRWRHERKIGNVPFDHYRELYLRIHGATRQTLLCGHERGLGRRNIYEYWLAGQENMPDTFPGADWFDDTLMYHPPHTPERDVYISPHCKTQGNITFTFAYWSEVVHRLIDAGLTVTVGYDGHFCEDLNGHPLYHKHWGDHRQWMEQLCRHRIVACGNTGTGWLAAACGIPLLTMEPPNSQMPDHRYRECGLRNLVEVLSEPDAAYCARRLVEECRRVVVMTTGCYDILHAGHVRHLERSRALGSRLIVALNSDASVSSLKGPGRPINPQNQRKAVLEALRCVDEVRIFDGPNALDLIREIRPAILTNGYGYSADKIVGRDLVESWGGKAVITCAGDATDEPSTTKIVQRLHRVSETMDAVRAGAAYSINPPSKLRIVAEEFMRVITAGILGDVADLGSWRGGVALMLRRLAPERPLHLFDTWTGNPYDDPLCHHKKGEWAAPLEDCQAVVGKDALTHYHQGVFPNSAANLNQDYAPGLRRFCFVYCDMDTEQATRDALVFFLPRLSPGGVIMFDDYGWGPCAGVKKAVDDVITAEGRRVIQSNYTCVVTKR